MARITVEDCVDKFPSRFELVLVASQRARNLHAGEEPTVERDNDKNTVIALREIADSTISVNDMKENLIEEYQTITINDEEKEHLEIDIDKSEENDDNSSLENRKNIDKEIDEEIKNLSSAEEKEMENQFEISEQTDLPENDSSVPNADNSSE
tara:strand:- start:522 stop:980 length:459 start_codon:yes stop_codon:yes gene_type:complete